MTWKDRSTELKIIKSIIAMSKIQDGGTIILGIEESGDGITYRPVGMTKEHLESFNSDEVHDQVSKYADPFIDFRLEI